VSLLTAGNARVKEARKLSRRSVRTERRLFLVEGWKAVAEAAALADCVACRYARGGPRRKSSMVVWLVERARRAIFGKKLAKRRRLCAANSRAALSPNLASRMLCIQQ